MNRPFALAATATALLALASVIAVHEATSPRGSSGTVAPVPAPDRSAPAEVAEAEPERSAAPVPPPAPPPPPVAPAAPLRAGPTPIEPPDVVGGGAPVVHASAREPWTSVPLRPREMRALWIEIRNKRPDLARCWEASAAPAGAPPAALMLELETSGEGLRVVDAPLERTGALPGSAVACAQAQLRGLVLDVQAPPETAGGRMRMRYVLQ